MSDDMIEVPRQAVETLVTSLQGAWWLEAADAYQQLRAALNEQPTVESILDNARTFGQRP